jgi:tetratricopeptide (TPR) repeat protein
MAEGFVESFLGAGEVEDLEADAPGAPLADAVAMDLSGGSEEARSYLKDARRLIAIQTEHLHEQRALILKHMRVRRWREMIQLGFQLVLTLLGAAVALGVGIMLYDAFSSRSVVVDAFDAPPALAARGISGKVAAKGVLDALQKLEDATRASSKGLSTRGAWASDIKIEVPETGVSIGEVDRLLRARFGHDLQFDGDLVQTDKGDLALTVRGDGVPAKTFTGGAGDLDKLTTAAAEYIYGRSQPLQYATYLEDAGRNQDALAFLPGAFSRAPKALRPALANLWGFAYVGVDRIPQALQKHRLTMSLAPRGSQEWWEGWANLVGETVPFSSPGAEEAAWRESQAFLQAYRQTPRRSRPELRVVTNPAQFVWDLPLQLATIVEDTTHNGGAGTFIGGADAAAMADIQALMHDPAAAARSIALSDPDDPATKAEALLLEGYSALDRGDPGAAIPPLETFDKAWRADTNLQYTYPDNLCFLGLAYGLAGSMSEAEAVFKRAVPFARCQAFHGDVLAHAGDVAGAQRVWAEALKIGPDLPMVYLHRGLWEMSQGDLKAAASDLATARAKAPHYADTRKAFADLLAREGRWQAALAEYDEALKYAPAWAELRRMRAMAARRA